ncbi:MAG: hypothetical protein A2W98_03845 [Bacteroidetes bacterium GWF2_33_38]|nr:MAG: hypothetical protein A2W98_03845 [Bacteroidetes bacterium GWF2_33_38]OFY75712.1 MAG: hypothetical protein A2265_04440 [Bacteroidetes bacterium RIFOXYA12_FULL_33_9]
MKTLKLKKVLIALDYNPTAQKVAESGFSLAKSLGAEVFLLHIVTQPIYYSDQTFSPILGFSDYLLTDLLQFETDEDLKKASQHFLDKTKKHLGDNEIQTIVKEGNIAETILKTAKKLKIDIIVIGSHSQRWLENIIMGSETEDVLRLTTIPLFIIPTKKVKSEE